MKSKIKSFVRFLFLYFVLNGQSQIRGSEVSTFPEEKTKSTTSVNSVSDLIELLNNLALNSQNEFFKRHCISIIEVISAEKEISSSEESLLENFYSILSDTNAAWSAGKLSSYLERKRPFIISWTSPTDGAVSLAWLLPPKNWDPQKSYPMYVRLHGLYSPYQNPIEYMTYYLRKESFMTTPFEDGYSLLPWARGNLWYEGISETDVLESMSALEGMVKINPAKKYLCGFSMGGYGVWYIGHRSPDKWAALGIFAGALSYRGQSGFNVNAAQKLKDVPVYVVCGDSDGLLSDNRTAYKLLQDAGNQNLFFTTFPGGHEANYENQKKMCEWLGQWTNENVNSINTNDVPSNFYLYPNYPNPFNPETTVSYQVPSFSRIELKVFDTLGREVSTLVEKEQDAGIYEVKFDGKNLSSGIYFFRLRAGDYVETKKMTLIR